MSELGKRVAVAVVGIPAALTLVWLGGWFLSVPLALFAAWGAHEVARLAETRGVRPLEWVASPLAAALVLLASWRPTFPEFAPWALGLLAGASMASLAAALRLRGPSGAPLESVATTLLAALYVGLALAFAPLLHALPGEGSWGLTDGESSAAGLAALALPLVVTWMGDTAAFFAGSAWGKGRARLAPTISPNKSWVGFWAAIAAGAAGAVLWLLAVRGFGLGEGPGVPGVLAALGAVVALAAVVGDLVESLLKREAGVKDSGTFFPGHGGVLDRIDSLLFTIPTAYVALVLLGGGR